jgi:chemotaxis protein CheX
MDVKYINPFIDAVNNIFPQFGISNIKRNSISLKGKDIKSTGVIIMLGLIGDIRGNVIYSINDVDAMRIASTMMMGAPVETFDELAQSAISELTNMLTATAASVFSNEGIDINISTPTLVYGDFVATMCTEKSICIDMNVDGMTFEINIAMEKFV